MVWTPQGSRGFESDKIKFDTLPYMDNGVDIGCGQKKLWPNLVGLDNCKDTRLFGTHMNPDIVIADAARLGMFPSESMPAVYSSHTLEHIEDYRAALAEWWRLVAPGGHLMLYLPHAQFYPNIGRPGANPDHVHDFMPTDIVDAMREVALDWYLVENQDRNGGNEYSFFQVYRKTTLGSGQII